MCSMLSRLKAVLLYCELQDLCWIHHTYIDQLWLWKCLELMISIGSACDSHGSEIHVNLVSNDKLRLCSRIAPIHECIWPRLADLVRIGTCTYQGCGVRKEIVNTLAPNFFIGPSYGELYCGSFGVLQSKTWRLSPKLFIDYSLRNN